MARQPKTTGLERMLKEKPAKVDNPIPGRPVTSTRRRAMTVKLGEDVYQKLRKYAFDQERTHQEIMEEAILAYLAKR